MDKLAAMVTFVRAVEMGSFSAVAKERKVSRSSITKQIAALERELRVKLLERTTRSLVLTEPGELYFHRTRQIVQDVADTEVAIRLLRNPTCR